ncbi:hypothetical protein F2Q70_00021666 [Brassica cretica]|uniref:Uncharacterized protein n=1 Tax=Brassica cretica TaxID=69181 RepID=A0A8S9H357_BRACR|nr:hypothetical protein F2Q70_00021666 [Brassica cretica]KAF2550697.1 hypothetical protein F2Q68_00033409 [Brassica cretica]
MKQGVPITSDLLSQMKLVTKLGLEKKSSLYRQTLRQYIFYKVKNWSGHFGNLAWPWFLSLLNPKCRVWCLDIDRRYMCTSVDIDLHLSRHFLISIVSTDANRSIILPLVDLEVVSSGEMSFMLQNAPKS